MYFIGPIIDGRKFTKFRPPTYIQNILAKLDTPPAKKKDFCRTQRRTENFLQGKSEKETGNRNASEYMSE